MALLKCTACQGEYVDVLDDGLRYFHQCPPLTGQQLAAALRARTVQLSPRDQARLDAARAADVDEPRPIDQPTREAELFDNLAIPRPDARDENVDPRKVQARADGRTGDRDSGDAEFVQRAPGSGAIVLAPDDAV